MPDPSGYSADNVIGALLQALDEGVLVFDAQGVCRAAGRRAAEVLGLDPAAAVGLSRAEVLSRVAGAAKEPEALAPLDGSGAEPHERTVVDPIVLVRAVTGGGDAPSPSARAVCRTVVWTSVPLTPAHPADTHPPGRLDLIRDVTRERRAEAAVEELGRRLEMESTLDDLTGLSNRRRFEEECLREHRRAQREWVSYGLARVDVDGMGGINERLGRQAGDELLRRIGEDLRTSRREYDVVARWKDDEFVVLLPRIDALALGRILKRAVDAVHAGARALVPGVTVSVGAAIWSPPSAEGPADLLHRAAGALDAARARGPGHVEADLGASEWKGGD